MSAEGLSSVAIPGASRDDVAVRSARERLLTLVVWLGIGWSVLFVVIGLLYGLQQYGDGSLFSYAVAVQDAWAFHLHNMSGRLLVYLYAFVPAESFVSLTRDARGGIMVYGFLFFIAQLLGLLATRAADRSKGRVIFGYACASTACFCPLVFGFPTEMWVAHAVFWPALAACHYARDGIRGSGLVFGVLLALAFTHEGAIVLEVAILCTLGLRGLRDDAFRRAAVAFLVVMVIWGIVKAIYPPDDYYVAIFDAAALHFLDVAPLVDGLSLLLLGTLAAYAILFLIFRRLAAAKAHFAAAAIVAVALLGYWLWFDRALHTDQRYFFRTALLAGTLAFGTLAAVCALHADGRLRVRILPSLMATLASDVTARAAAGAVLLVTLIHAVETAKFVAAWSHYTTAVQSLAAGTASDPWLGDGRFVSSDRIGAGLRRLSWNSTTLYLSVLAAPGFAPARLVVNPRANYFWLSCATATANQEADRAVPVASRALVRALACLHR